MVHKHAADNVLPTWMNNLAEGRVTKKASPEEEAFVPYGMNENEDETGGQSFENFVTGLIREDEGEAKVNDEKLEEDEALKVMEKEVEEEKLDDLFKSEKEEDSDSESEEKERAMLDIPLEKKEPTPWLHLPIDEKEVEEDKSALNVTLGIEEKEDEEPTPPEPTEEPPANDADEEDAPEDDTSFAPPGAPVDEGKKVPKGGEGADEMAELKKGLEDLGEVKDLESRMKRIETLLENLQGPATADPDMNDSIFQSADVISEIKRSNRIIRRIKAGILDREDAINKLNKIISKI